MLGNKEKGKREKGRREKGRREKGRREKGRREKGRREKGKRGKERGYSIRGSKTRVGTLILSTTTYKPCWCYLMDTMKSSLGDGSVCCACRDVFRRS